MTTPTHNLTAIAGVTPRTGLSGANGPSLSGDGEASFGAAPSSAVNQVVSPSPLGLKVPNVDLGQSRLGTIKSWKVGKPHGLTKVEIEGQSATPGRTVLIAVCDPRNAPLIAAAPDLLAACATAARGVADVVLAQLRAAIAKAKPSEGGAA